LVIFLIGFKRKENEKILDFFFIRVTRSI